MLSRGKEEKKHVFWTLSKIRSLDLARIDGTCNSTFFVCFT